VKFSCGRCGKRYATAETPAPGRVYKIKCKACGHLIVVKASAAEVQTATTELRPQTATDVPSPATAGQAPSDDGNVSLEIGAPEPHTDAATPRSILDDMPALTPPPMAVPRHPDTTQEVSVPGLAAAPDPVSFPGQSPPPPTERYVDLFAGDPAKPEVPAKEDPFAAAARASLPDDYGKSAPAPDPFGSLKAAEKPAAPPPPAAAKMPVIAKPAQEKSNGPLILIVVGALVLVGILAFVLLGGQKPPAAPSAPPPVAAAQPAPAAPTQAAPVPTPAASPAPVAAAPTPAPEPAAAAKPEKTEKKTEKKLSAAERRAREREAKEAKEREARAAREREKAAREARDREAREARERDKLARDLKAREERDARERERIEQEQERVAAATAGEPVPEALTQDQVQKVLSANRKHFETCITTAGKAGMELDGRRVLLRLNIQQTGAVTYPTLDDVTLNGTDLGSCLKSTARVMVFPKFKGDPMHVEVPLVIAPPK
jgi:DNA-directed RNA polymerase subunit RPC12/RpoP